MVVYAINYDLRSRGQDYDELIDAIEGLGDSCHILESMWFVVADGPSSEIRDELKEHIDSNDELLVTKFKGGWATTFTDDRTEWLREYV